MYERIIHSTYYELILINYTIHLGIFFRTVPYRTVLYPRIPSLCRERERERFYLKGFPRSTLKRVGLGMTSTTPGKVLIVIQIFAPFELKSCGAGMLEEREKQNRKENKLNICCFKVIIYFYFGSR